MFDTSDVYVNLFIGLIILLIGLKFVYYYCSHIVRAPVLTCKSTEFKSFLKESMPILSEKYWPTIWCYGSRFQSFLQIFCRIESHIPYEREIIKFDDGGQAALDWLHPESKRTDVPIILILPGITGTSRKAYVKKFVLNAHKCNFRSLVFNYRGLGGVELTTPKLYCMNDTADLVKVAQHIKDRFPEAVLGACGVSMGAQMLVHYFVQYSHLRKISFAMLNCTLFDVPGTAKRMVGGVDGYISKLMAYDLRKTVARFKEILDTTDAPWNLAEVMKSETIQEFDDALTSKMFGYDSVHEYYKEATLLDKMHRIKIPVLCLSAADDPLQPLNHFKDCDAPLFDNDKVAVMITAAGGHISHLEGFWPFHKEDSYLHRVFIQYFSAMFKNDSYKLFLP